VDLDEIKTDNIGNAFALEFAGTPAAAGRAIRVAPSISGNERSTDMFKFNYAALSDIGLVRPENEDVWVADRKMGLFIVADGIGGIPNGAMAAKIVVDSLQLLFKKPFRSPRVMTADCARRMLNMTVPYLSRQLREFGRCREDQHGLGTTLVVAWLRQEHLVVAHLGDSRAYLLRDGSFRRLTTDHTLFQEMLAAGTVSPEQEHGHPASRRLTRYMGMDGEPLPDIQTLPIQPRDRLLLCTDGLSDHVPEAEIGRCLGQGHTPRTTCRRLVASAKAAGGHDNITVLVADFHA